MCVARDGNRIGLIQVEKFKDGWAYRKCNSLTFTLFTCSLDELKKQLIDEFNSKIMRWVNEEGISEKLKNERIEYYNKVKWVDVEFYSERCFCPLIMI